MLFQATQILTGNQHIYQWQGPAVHISLKAK